MKRRVALVVLIVAFGAAWRPLIRPGLQATVSVADIYSTVSGVLFASPPKRPR